MEELYPDARTLAVATVRALRSLYGTIPRDLYADFTSAGFRIPVRAFAPRERAPRALSVERPPCPGKTKKGTPCKNKACFGHEMCMIHYKQSVRMVSEIETVLTCTAATSKGESCKCRRFRGFELCWRHAKKEGLIADVPSDCAICMNEMAPSERTKTKCGHYFHTACLTEWATRRGSSHRRRIAAPCPMCRAPFSLPTPPAPPLEGPDWYVMGNTAPTALTSADEWVQRLRAIPMDPMMTSVMLRHRALAAGQSILQIENMLGEYPSDFSVMHIMNDLGITRA